LIVGQPSSGPGDAPSQPDVGRQSTTPSPVARYAVAVGATLCALLVRLALGPVILPSPFMTFIVAVLLSAWFGGMRAGMVASGFSVLLAHLFILPPPLSEAARMQLTAIRSTLFLAAAFGVSWGTAALQASQRRIIAVRQAAQAELEARVATRTAELRAANRLLSESEDKFRTLAETVSVAAVIFQGSAVRYVNPATTLLTGYTRDELLGTHFWDLVHPEHREGIRERGLARQRGEVAGSHDEAMIVTKTGEIRWVAFSAGTIEFEGRPAVLGTAFDITDHKRWGSDLEQRVAQRTTELQEANRLLREEIRQREDVENALRDSEERFRATLEQAAVGIAMVGRDGRWLLVNDRLCQMFGYTKEELLQRSFRDITHPDDLATSLTLVGQLVTGQRATFSTEKRYLRKDGSVMSGSMNGSAVRDGGGAFKYGIAVVQDIGDRKRAETELRAAEERLRRLVENLPAITYVLALDEMPTTLYVSPQVEATLGFTVDEWTRDPELWSRQLHPDDRERVSRAVASSHATGLPFSSEYRMYRRDGALLWFHDEAAVIRDEQEKLLFSQGVMIDITARKHAEEELEAANRRTLNILDDMSSGFFALDPGWRFTYINPVAAGLLGHPAAALVGKNVWEEVPDLAHSAFGEQYRKVMAERVTVEIEAYYPPFNRWYRARGYPGRTGMSVLFEDVTEAHEQEVTALSDILRALNAELAVAAAFPRVAAGLQVLTQCDRSSLVFFDQQYEHATVVALSGERADVRAGTRIAMHDLPASLTVIAGQTHVVSDLAVELRSPVGRTIYADGFRSVMCLPLRGTERVLGMLTLTWRKLDGANAVSLPLLNQVADAVALAAEKSLLFEEVRVGRERLEALSRRLLEVQEAERQHIARELHDEIGQALTALKLSLDTGASVAADAPPLADTRRQVNELLTRVRSLALDLRPAMLDDLGLLPALLWLFERYAAQGGVRVHFEHRGLEARFNAEIETAAFRIIQEGLTNVARHARVPQVTVRAWSDPSTLSVQIVDEGIGFDAGAALAAGISSGMTGMRERAVLLGGQLTVESAPGKGTRVSAELPLASGASEGRSEVIGWP